MTALDRLPPVALLAALSHAVPAAGIAQQRDTTTDSLQVYTAPPAVVSVTRTNPHINRIPQAVQHVERAAISRGRPTWGLDEALVSVPGVYAANRCNFSVDQRISIRGFGARAQFAVRGLQGPGGRDPANPPRRNGAAHEPGAGGDRPDRGAARVVVGAVR